MKVIKCTNEKGESYLISEDDAIQYYRDRAKAAGFETRVIEMPDKEYKALPFTNAVGSLIKQVG